MINCTLIDNSTGEILTDNFKIDKIEDQKRRREMAEKAKLSAEFKALQQEVCGNFIFFIFKNISDLENILNDTELVEYIFTGTYVKKEGALILDNNLTYVTKKMLKQLLNISDEAFRLFYNKLIDNDLLVEKDNKLYISLEYFWRGKEKNYKLLAEHKIEDFSRVYIKSMRDLYTTTPTRSHKKLATIYKLLPYINWRYNIVCSNINELDKTKIEPLTVSNVLELLRYDKTHITRFKKEFYSIKYNDYQVFKTVQGDSEYIKSYIIANPLVFYRGNDIKELEGLITLFQVKI